MLETGLLLVLIPWSAFWERNYFGQLLPGVGDLITNNYLRGGITGLGLVNIWIALTELADLVGRYFQPTPPHDA